MSLAAWYPGLRLANPWVLVLLAALPLWLLLVARARRRTGGLTFPAGLLGDLPRSWRIRWQPLPDLLRALALAALIVALARPQLGYTREKISQRGIDLVLALDVSSSMGCEDIEPSRFQAAQRTVLRFLDRLTSDRVGLVVFAGRAFTQCPLTTDYLTVKELVRECHLNMVEFGGTAVGEAVAAAINRLDADAARRSGQERAQALAAAKQRSRVVVLVSDGAHNQGEVLPLEAAEMARVRNIRVHCIGLGSPEGAPLPVYEAGRRGYQTLNDQVVIYRLDEALLQQVADHTGGRYFRATDARMLDAVYQQIASMEKSDVEVKHLVHYDERFLAPLVVALGLLLAELLLRATVLRVTT